MPDRNRNATTSPQIRVGDIVELFGGSGVPLFTIRMTEERVRMVALRGKVRLTDAPCGSEYGVRRVDGPSHYYPDCSQRDGSNDRYGSVLSLQLVDTTCRECLLRRVSDLAVLRWDHPLVQRDVAYLKEVLGEAVDGFESRQNPDDSGSGSDEGNAGGME